MPALKTCGKPWNVGSDDFGLASLFAIVVRIISVGLLVGVLIYLYIGPPECDGVFEKDIPALLYGALFAFITIEVMVLMNEGVLLSISCRGKIWYEDPKSEGNHPKSENSPISEDSAKSKPHPRRHFLVFLFLRVILYFIEFALIVLNIVTFFSKFITDDLECQAYHDGPIVFGKIISVILLVVLIFYGIGFLVYSDPLGCCCAPSVMKDMRHVEEIGEKDLEDLDDEHKNHLRKNNIGKVHTSHLGNGRVLRKLRGFLCCSSAGGRRSRAVAVQEMSAALSTLFSDQDWVPSDLVAGLILVSRNQRQKRESCGCFHDGEPCSCLIDGFKDLTFQYMPKEHKKPGYVGEKPQCYNFKDLGKQLLFEDLVHYMEYAMGIYGWSLHVFDNLCCGLCQLGRVTCCSCNYSWRHKRFGVDIINDGCCLTGIGTIRLQSSLKETQIKFASYDNEVYQAPFSVCVDDKMKAVVITIRGTLSIKDALTDLSVSMYNPDIKGFSKEQSYIHNGMYRTAKSILTELQKREILEDLFMGNCWDYQLVITGHSLGAGVASVIAVLLRANYGDKPFYRDLICYAFSPPGCIFSFPLALYSRDFITTVVLGNDMIPRVTFPSLLYLKRQLLFLLKKCKKSKPQILFQPRIFDNNRLFDFCCGQHKDTEGHEVDHIKNEVLQESTFKQDLTPDLPLSFKAIIRAKSFAKKWKKKAEKDEGDTLHHFVKAIESREQIASFPPGKVVHIQVGKSAKACCLGFCYPNQLQVFDISSEDFCVIMIDKGMIDDHLPNEVLGALKRSKHQLMGNRDKKALASKRKEIQDKLTSVREEFRQQEYESKAGSDVPPQQNGTDARLNVLTIDGPQLNTIHEESNQSGQKQVEVYIEMEGGNDGELEEGAGSSDTALMLQPQEADQVKSDEEWKQKEKDKEDEHADGKVTMV